MKTLIATPLEGTCLDSIKHWLKTYDPNRGPVEFVHIIQRVLYPVDLMGVQESPTQEQFKMYRETFSEHLRHQLFPSLPDAVRASSKVTVLLANDEEEEMVHHIKESGAKLLVVGTRNLKGFAGLFASSFAQKMLKRAPCDVLILRPR